MYQRDDDAEHVVKQRIKVYEQNTAPLIDFYTELVSRPSIRQSVSLRLPSLVLLCTVTLPNIVLGNSLLF